MDAAVTSFLALIFVLGIMFALMWVVRRFRLLPGQFAPNGKIKNIIIKESRGIDARNRLVLVEWDGSEYLLGIGQNGIQKIASKPVDTTAEGDTSKGYEKFSALIKDN